MSLRWVQGPNEEQLRAIYPYLAELGLEPRALAQRKRAVALVDVVSSTGETLETLLRILKNWNDGL